MSSLSTRWSANGSKPTHPNAQSSWRDFTAAAIKFYGQRETIRWDQIPEEKLEATLRNLGDQGYDLYLALDVPSEPPLFQARFGAPASTVAEQIARVRVVNIYRFVSAH